MSEARAVLPVPDEFIDAIAERVREQLERELQELAEPWVGVAEAAEHLGCKPQRIYDLVSASDTTGIPFVKEGTRLLFKRSALDEWLARRPPASR